MDNQTISIPVQFAKEFYWFQNLSAKEKSIYIPELWRFFFDKNENLRYEWNEKVYKYMIDNLAYEAKIPARAIANQIILKCNKTNQECGLNNV